MGLFVKYCEVRSCYERADGVLIWPAWVEDEADCSLPQNVCRRHRLSLGHMVQAARTEADKAGFGRGAFVLT